MSVLKKESIKDLLSKDYLMQILPGLRDIKLENIKTNGLSGAKIYKITLFSRQDKKSLYLKINNLKEDWLAKVNKDEGRELAIFKDDIYSKLEEFINDIYLGYYIGDNSYAILMNDMSVYKKTNNSEKECLYYLNNLAKFHSKFKEHDVINYKELLNVDEYCNFLTKTKVSEVDEFKENYQKGEIILKDILGENLFNKYDEIKEIDSIFSYYPKTFLHGDYRPDNTLYINKNDIRIIDWANSGCGPCTLDVFWYLMTSVNVKFDKTILLNYYKMNLENYIGYKLTRRTWDTLLKVGILTSCKMYLVSLLANSNLEDKYEYLNIYYWIENLKSVLIDL